MNLAPIGFWRKRPAAPAPGEEDLPYPQPAPGPQLPLRLLQRYLTAHAYLESYEHGASTCRLCGAQNGCATLTDGVHVWPEGLAHYVLAHAVPLPGGFIRHIEAAAAAAAAGAGAPAQPEGGNLSGDAISPPLPPALDQARLAAAAALLPVRNHLLWEVGQPPSPVPSATLAWLRARSAVLDLGQAAP